MALQLFFVVYSAPLLAPFSRRGWMVSFILFSVGESCLPSLLSTQWNYTSTCFVSVSVRANPTRHGS